MEHSVHNHHRPSTSSANLLYSEKEISKEHKHAVKKVQSDVKKGVCTKDKLQVVHKKTTLEKQEKVKTARRTLKNPPLAAPPTIKFGKGLNDTEGQKTMQLLLSMLSSQVDVGIGGMKQFFKDGFDSINNSAQLSSVIKDATIKQYNAKADQMSDQATMKRNESIISFTFAGAIFAFTACDVVAEMGILDEAPKPDEIGFSQEGDPVQGGAGAADNEAAANEIPLPSNAMERFKEAYENSTLKKLSSYIQKGMAKCLGKANLMTMLQEMSKSFNNTHGYKQIAKAQTREGKAQVDVKFAEQSAQVLGQREQRADTLRKNSLSSLKAMQSDITRLVQMPAQTAQQLFRG